MSLVKEYPSLFFPIPVPTYPYPHPHSHRYPHLSLQQPTPSVRVFDTSALAEEVGAHDEKPALRVLFSDQEKGDNELDELSQALNEQYLAVSQLRHKHDEIKHEVAAKEVALKELEQITSERADQDTYTE